MALSPPGASPGADSVPRSFQDEVCEIREDPDIWRLAVRRAGSFDLAEDALQDTFYAVARVKDPERIENLRAFFCRALIRQIAHLRGRLGPLPVEDPEAVIGRHPRIGGCRSAADVSVDDGVLWQLRAEEWLERFRVRRRDIRAAVPERSDHAACYRAVIVKVAEDMLRAGCDGEVRPADFDAALRNAYPRWFAETGCAQDTRYQRLSRGRRDVRQVLQAIVSWDELSS
jgi:DNA-directed RNA polymerase specialized sigma24 family protein